MLGPLQVPDGDPESLADAEMEGNVAAIVHICPVKMGNRSHDRQNLIGHRAGDCGHRRHEVVQTMWLDRPAHSPSDRPLRPGCSVSGLSTKQWQFIDEFPQ